MGNSDTNHISGLIFGLIFKSISTKEPLMGPDITIGTPFL